MFDSIMNDKIWVLVLISSKKKRGVKRREGALRLLLWQTGSFFRSDFLPYFTGFSDFNKVSDNHLGIPKCFSQTGHLDFPFSTHELVVDIALLLSNLFCQKNGA